MTPSPEIRYHAATFALVGEEPVITPESRAAVDAWEQAEGVRLPASLREWYSLANGLNLLAQYSNQDEPEPLAARERVCRAFDLQYAELPPEPELMIVPLKGVPDWLQVVEVLHEPGYVRLMTENQCVVRWHVPLTGEDPPVYSDMDSVHLADWQVESKALSTFLFDWVCDFAYPNRWPRESPKIALSKSPLPRDDELEFLRREYCEGPRTPGDIAGWWHRFFDRESCILIGLSRSEDDPSPAPYWEIRAASIEALERALQKLWRLGSFAAGVGPYFDPDERVEALLKRLGWREDAETDSPAYHYRRGRALRLQAVYDRDDRLLASALEHLNRALELDPGRRSAYEERISCHERLGDYHSMISDYGRVIELSPEARARPWVLDRPFWYKKRGECYERLGELERAADDYCAAIRLNPDSDPSERATRLAKAGRDDLAHRIYECWRESSQIALASRAPHPVLQP